MDAFGAYTGCSIQYVYTRVCVPVLERVHHRTDCMSKCVHKYLCIFVQMCVCICVYGCAITGRLVSFFTHCVDAQTTQRGHQGPHFVAADYNNTWPCMQSMFVSSYVPLPTNSPIGYTTPIHPWVTLPPINLWASCRRALGAAAYT